MIKIKQLASSQEEEFIDRCEEYLSWVSKKTKIPYKWEREKAYIELDYVLKNGMVYIAEKANKIIGAVAFAVSPMFMSAQKIASEVVWHCNGNLPRKTKYKVLISLIKRAEKWAIENKVERLIISANSKNPAVKILNKYHFFETETFYEKELNYGI
jgi:hypothetical protein